MSRPPLLNIERMPGGNLHVWVGPVGLHLFWPDWWKSRPGWCPQWREPLR